MLISKLKEEVHFNDIEVPGGWRLSAITSKNEEIRFIFTVQTGNAKFPYRRHWKFKRKSFFQLREKVDVDEHITASAVILCVLVLRLLVQVVKSVISSVKEELVFQENTGGGILGVREWVRRCTSNNVGDLAPFHLWLQTLLCLHRLCPELSDCPFILFYPWTLQCLRFFSSCSCLLESCFDLGRLHTGVSPCLSSYCVCLRSLFWFRPSFFFFFFFWLKICWFVVSFSFSQRPPTIISVFRFIQINSKAKSLFCCTEED